MARLIGLSRVSAVNQKTNSSFEHQADAIRKYCEIYGHELVDLQQIAESASGEKSRKVFDQIISDVLENKADGLIVMRVDRFARNTLAGLKVAHNLRAAGKILVVVELGLDTSTYVGRFVLTTLLASAELEASLIEARAKAGRQIARDNGYFCGGRPRYGQKTIGGRGQHQLTSNAQELELIALVHELRAAGKSLRQIANHLNAAGIKNRRGKLWAFSTIKLLLKYERPGAPYTVHTSSALAAPSAVQTR